MHPFYGPSGRLMAGRESVLGVVTMFAYLAFWAGAVAIAMRKLDERFPKQAPATMREDAAISLLRERYARGEIDRDQFLRMRQDLERDRVQDP